MYVPPIKPVNDGVPLLGLHDDKILGISLAIPREGGRQRGRGREGGKQLSGANCVCVCGPTLCVNHHRGHLTLGPLMVT